MATYSRREVVTKRVEFIVPAPAGIGCPYVEVLKAISAAENELIAQRDKGSTVYDDEIKVFVGDDAVILSIDAETASVVEEIEARQTAQRKFE